MDNQKINSHVGDLILRFLTYALTVVQIIVATILVIKLLNMKMFPNLYLLFFVFGIIIVSFFDIKLAKKKVFSVFMCILTILLVSVMIYGTVALYHLDHTVSKVTSNSQMQVEMAVVVLNDDLAVTVSDLAGYTVSYIPTDEGVDEMMAELDLASGGNVQYESKDNVIVLADELLNKKTKAILLNRAYIDLIGDVEGYEEFPDDVRILSSTEVAIEMPNQEATEEVEKEEEEDTFIVYISGIDTFGSVSVTSRSDVNIIAAVDTQTGKIQLINTPRDYYVPLPISNGSKDKLTHAGIYGIDTSIGTMEMLYGIQIDYYVRMNFSGFEDIIDTLGGIDVYSEYDFTVTPVKHYTVGYNHLSGVEALAFARERHAFAKGDVQRGKNQMAVITAMLQKLTSSEILYHYADILEDIADSFQTNMSPDRIYSLVREQLSNNTSWHIESFTVTGSDSRAKTFSMPGTTAYVMIPNEDDIETAKALITDVIGE